MLQQFFFPLQFKLHDDLSTSEVLQTVVSKTSKFERNSLVSFLRSIPHLSAATIMMLSHPPPSLSLSSAQLLNSASVKITVQDIKTKLFNAVAKIIPGLH